MTAGVLKLICQDLTSKFSEFEIAVHYLRREMLVILFKRIYLTLHALRLPCLM